MPIAARGLPALLVRRGGDRILFDCGEGTQRQLVGSVGLADLDEDDLHLLAAWHASLEVGQPIPNTDFLVGVFPSLGENRREALKIAAAFRGEEAFEAGVGEEQAFDTVLPWLSQERCRSLAAECLELYCWDRLGVEN